MHLCGLWTTLALVRDTQNVDGYYKLLKFGTIFGANFRVQILACTTGSSKFFRFTQSHYGVPVSSATSQCRLFISSVIASTKDLARSELEMFTILSNTTTLVFADIKEFILAMQKFSPVDLYSHLRFSKPNDYTMIFRLQ